MTQIIKRNKAMSVSPLKSSQTVGGALAFLGFDQAMPLMHGSQGCTAFAKVFFVRHFREPIPLQTTAMDQVSSVMGADDNVVEALRAIADKNTPAIIGLVTTGLAETQGCDIRLALSQFRQKYPQYEKVAVVPVNTPDFTGSFESGYASAVAAIIETLVPARTPSATPLRPRQVNVLCAANLTSGDLEFICESIESFGLRPLLIPDLSRSLDGHLSRDNFNPLTTGGLTIEELITAGDSCATLMVGESLGSAADRLYEKTGVITHRFGHLIGLDVLDRWFTTLAELSGQSVPERWRRQRQQLQDAMLDTHFMIGDSRVAIAADPDLVMAFHRLINSMGGHVSAAVIPARSTTIVNSELDSVKIGDLEDLENLARENQTQLLLGNSHAAESAQRLKVPLLRVGFPQYDLMGGFARCWCGYRGTQQILFDLANMLMEHHQGMQPYYSVLSQKRPEEQATGR